MDLGSAVDSESKILNFLVQPRQHKMAAIRLVLKRPKQQVVSGHMRLRSDIGTGATCSAAELLVTILSAVFPTIVPSLDAVVTSRATALIVPDADRGIQPAISPTRHEVVSPPGPGPGLVTRSRARLGRCLPPGPGAIV